MARARTATPEDEAALLPGSFAAPLPPPAPRSPLAAPRGFFETLGDPALDPQRAAAAAVPPPPAGPGAAELPGAFTTASAAPSFGQNLAQGVRNVTYGSGLESLYDLAAKPQGYLADLTGNEALRAKPAGERLESWGLPPPSHDWAGNVTQAGAATLGLAIPGTAALRANLVRGPVKRAVLGSLTDNPVGQAAAVLGQGTAETMAPDLTDSPLGQFAIGLGGGLIGGVGAGLARTGLQAVRGLAGNLDAGAMDLLLRGASDRAAAANRIAGYRPDPENQTLRAPDGSFVSNPDQAAALRNLQTTAEATGDRGLIVAEKKVRGLLGDDGQDRFGARDIERRDLRGNILSELTPGATDPRAPLMTAAAQAESDLQAARAAVPAPVPGTSTGPTLQRAFTEERTAGGDRVRAALDAVDPEGTAAVPTRPLVRAIRESADLHLPSDDPAQYPPEVRNLLSYLSGRSVTYDRLRNIKQAAGSMAAGQPGSSQTDFVMRDAMTAIEDHLNTPGVLPPDVAARHQAYLQAARDQGQRFAGPIAQDLRGKDAGGRPTAEQSTIPRQFFQPDSAGGPDSMAAFRRYNTDPNTGQLRPDAAAAMQGHVGGEVLKFTDPTTGVVNQVALDNWLRQHQQTLQAVPELGLYDNVNNLARAQRTANAAGVAGVKGPESLDGYQGNVARTLLGGDDLQASVGKILDNPNPAAALRDATNRMRGNPDAVQGLRRAVLDHWAEASVGSRPNTSGAPKLARGPSEVWWDANQPALRNSGLFTPAEMERLKTVHDDIWSGGQVGNAPSPDPAKAVSNARAMADWALSGGGESSPLWQAIKKTGDKATLGFFGQYQQARAGRLISRLYEFALDPEIAGQAMRRFTPETARDLAATVQDRSVRRYIAQTARAGIGGLGTAARAALPSARAAIPEGP